ncbi:MAG: hypothetical protein IKL79_03180 [Clostridia bacterium]|nr:hypothetical protein [Clostridia bacterium]MBR3680989.1 hypothetical protein [Clostridia bacterium]
MAATVYAIDVVMTNGNRGYVKFYGDGTWDWHLVSNVDEATLYRTQQEAVDDFYKYVKDAVSEYGARVDRSRCTIAECYAPWA